MSREYFSGVEREDLGATAAREITWRRMTASYSPRQYAVPPATFGKARDIAWRNTDLSERDRERLYASQIQHEVAFQINAALQQLRWTQADYAREAKMTAQRIGAVLRGAVPMRLEDLGVARRIFNIHTTVVHRDSLGRQ
jgi:hypothetical protein